MSSIDGDATVIDAEVVSSHASHDEDQSQVLLSLEEMIKTHINSIDRMQNELKEARQMFEDGFINDPTFREIAQKAKEAAEISIKDPMKKARVDAFFAEMEKILL